MSFSDQKLGWDLPCYSKDGEAPIYMERGRMDVIDSLPKLTFSRCSFIQAPLGVIALMKLLEVPRGTKMDVVAKPYCAVLLHEKTYQTWDFDVRAKVDVEPTPAELLFCKTLKEQGLVGSEDIIGEGHLWYQADATIWNDDGFGFVFQGEFVFTSRTAEDEAFLAVAKQIKDSFGATGANGKKPFTPQKTITEIVAERKPLLRAETLLLSDDAELRMTLKAMGIDLAQYLAILFSK